jgi:O-antigen/teichoic acid export membrane protein
VPKRFARGYPLLLVSLVEYGTPVLRIFALSHLLTLRELGVASALTATAGALGLITDFALHRFVLSAPREKYREALAGAQAVALVRSLIVAALGAVAAPMIAAALSLPQDWFEFALLGIFGICLGFEHLGPKVAERDYNYMPQFKAVLCANGASLIVLLLALLLGLGHRALLASMLTQLAVQAVASHKFADLPYALNFRSPLFWGGVRFGLPLMINGLGTAASLQGDRFIVGGLLGMPELGVYAIVSLATLMPLSLLSRLGSSALLAGLYNSARTPSYTPRLRLAAGAVALISGLYALGVVTLLNLVVPLVFGAKFILPQTALVILALAMFLRAARTEPFTSMLLLTSETHRLAIANFSFIISLPFEFVLLLMFHNFEAVMAGRLLGEIVAFITTLHITRDAFAAARRDYALALAGAAAMLLVGGALTYTTSVGQSFWASGATVTAAFAFCAFWFGRLAPPLLADAFPGIDLSGWPGAARRARTDLSCHGR